MLSPTRFLSLVVFGLTTSALPLPSAAQSSTFIEYYLSGSPPFPARISNFNGVYNASGPSSDYYDPTLTGIVSVSGTGTYGTAGATAGGSGVGFFGGTWTGWDDTISVNSSSAASGTHALWTINFNANWAFQSQTGLAYGYSYSNAFVDANLYQVNSSGVQIGRIQYGAAGEEYDSSCYDFECHSNTSAYYNFFSSASPAQYVAGVATMTFDVILGSSYFFEPGINASVDGHGLSTFVDASQSMSWLGSSLTDLNGHPLDYTIGSASGFNYAQASISPIPEPSTYGMLLFGLAAVGWFTHRRKLLSQV